jgi:hypothetical protein
VLADRRLQFIQCLRVERFARLVRVRLDTVDRDLPDRIDDRRSGVSRARGRMER